MKTENLRIDKVGAVREAQLKAIWELFLDVCSEQAEDDLVAVTLFDDMSGSISGVRTGETIRLVEFTAVGNYKLRLTWLG